MASKFINDFKKTYPDFKDVPDEDLAKGIYNNYYKADGVKEEDFFSTIGLESPSSKTSRDIANSIDTPVDVNSGKYSDLIKNENTTQTPADIATTLTPENNSNPKVELNTILNPNKENIDIPDIPTLRTSTEAMGDTFHAMGAGVGNVIKGAGTISGLVTGDMNNPVVQFGSQMSEDFKDQYSSQKKEWDRADKEKIDSADGEINKAIQVLKNYANTPQNIVTDLTEQIPQIGAMFLGGAGTKATAEVLGASNKVANKIGTIGTIATEAGLSGADSGGDAYTSIMRLPDEVWNNSPEYQVLIKSGIEPNKAKEAMALEESRFAAGITGALTFGLNKFLPNADMIEKALVGDMSGIAAKGLAGKVAGVASETFVEGADEAQSKINSNIAIQNIDPNQSLTSGVGEASAKGTILGAATSGGIVVADSMTPKSDEQKKQIIENELNKSIENTDLQQENILNQINPNQAYYQQQNQESQNINNSPTPTVETPIVNKQLEDVTQGFTKLQEEIKANNEKPIEELLQKDLEVKVADEPTPNPILDNNIIANQEVQNQDSTLPVPTVEEISNQDTINPGENGNVYTQANELNNKSIPQSDESTTKETIDNNEVISTNILNSDESITEENKMLTKELKVLPQNSDRNSSIIADEIGNKIVELNKTVNNNAITDAVNYKLKIDLLENGINEYNQLPVDKQNIKDLEQLNNTYNYQKAKYESYMEDFNNNDILKQQYEKALSDKLNVQENVIPQIDENTTQDAKIISLDELKQNENIDNETTIITEDNLEEWFKNNPIQKTTNIKTLYQNAVDEYNSILNNGEKSQKANITKALNANFTKDEIKEYNKYKKLTSSQKTQADKQSLDNYKNISSWLNENQSSLTDNNYATKLQKAKNKVDKYYKQLENKTSKKSKSTSMYMKVGETFEEKIINTLDSDKTIFEERPYTLKEWNSLFSNNKILSPIGEITLGKNQFAKLDPTIADPKNTDRKKQDRRGHIDYIYKTLIDPTYIVKKDNQYIFIKEFIKDDNSTRKYSSIVIEKDGLKINISNHNLHLKQVIDEIKKADSVINTVEVATNQSTNPDATSTLVADESITKIDENSQETLFARNSNTPMPNNPKRLTGKQSIRLDDKMTLRGQEVSLPDKFAPMTPAKIRKQVIDIIGNRLYFSKIKQKAEGFYRKKTGETRIKEINNVEVYAHEMAHYLDFYNGNKIFRNAYKNTRFKNEVESFSYTDANDLKGIEGFAEFVRAWLTQYEFAKTKAPNFTQEFERILKETKLETKMNKLQEDMHKWYNQGDEASFSALIGDKKSKLDWLKEVIFNIISYAKNNAIVSLLDRGHGFTLAEFTMFGELQKGHNSSVKLIRLALGGHTGVYESIIKYGTPKLTDRGDLTFSGKGLSEIFAPVLNKGNKEDIQNFKELMEYFAAVQANEMMIQGKKTPFSQSQINTILERGNQKPIYKKVFKEYQEFNDRMLDFYIDMNYLTVQDVENFKNKNSVYVPMQRVVESMGQNDGYAGGFFGRKGSDRNIRDIEKNITEQLFHHIKGAMIARAKSTLFNQLDRHEDGSLFAVKLAPDSKRVKVNIEQQAKKIVEVLYDAGMMLDTNGDIIEIEDNVTLEEAINNTIDVLIQKPHLMNFISFGHKPKNTGSHIEEVIINGERRYFEVQKGYMGDILNVTLNNLGGFQTGWFLNMLSNIKNIQTRFITNMPQFKFPNFVRDTMEAQFFSKHGAVNPLKGLIHYYEKSDSYKHFMLNGGGYGTRVDGTKNVNPNEIFQGSWGDKYDKLMNGDEYANRIAAAENAIEAGENWIEAAFQGRDITTDFSMTGANETLRTYHKITTFYQANVNSFYKLVRAIKDEGNSPETYFKAVSFLTARGLTRLMPIAILSFLSNVIFGDDDDREKYKALTADEMARFSHINIYGTDDTLTLPVAHATGFLFVKIPEYLLNMAFNKDGIVENKYQDAVKFAMLNQVLPVPTTGIAGAVIQHLQNKNFLGSPIIPADLQDKESGKQYLPNTPEIYKQIGKTGLSPLLTQHYVKALIGYVETAMAGAAQMILWDKEKWGEMPYSSAKDYTHATFFKQFYQYKEDKRTVYTEEYYKYRDKIKEAAATLEGVRKNIPIEGIEEYKQLINDKEFIKISNLEERIKKADSIVSKIKYSEEKIYFNKAFTAKEKEEKIQTLYKQSTDVLKKQYESIHPILKEVK